MLLRLRKFLRTCVPLRRFVRNRDGVTAVEFSLVAVPFLVTMFATLETALIFFSQQTLENAVAAAARQVRTGQAQAQNFSATQFKQEICNRIAGLLDCSKLVFDVRTYATFDSLDLDKPFNSVQELTTDGFDYKPGHGGDIVLVRAFYKRPTFTDLLNLDFSNMAGGYHLLAAAAAFRNEPFPW